MLDLSSKIFVAGSNGMVGSAIVRALRNKGYHNLVLKNSKELDLRDTKNVSEFFKIERPDFVFLAAAKVGGIWANNTYPASFLYDNLMIQNNVIHQSYLNGVKKLLFLGSSCIYPKFSPQPIKEEYLLTGSLEPTNEAYAVAKISGVEMCKYYKREHGCNFISAMPTNLYGINDNFNLQTSHVLPGLLRKFLEARNQGTQEVVIWGTGSPLREFLYVDDLAEACLFLMNYYNEETHINVGTGEETSIKGLAGIIQNIVGFKGSLVFDKNKPDGTPRKLLDVSKINQLGWKHKTSLDQGIKKVKEWVETNQYSMFS